MSGERGGDKWRHAGLRIRETKEVYEGEVIEMTPEETENAFGGYQKQSMWPFNAIMLASLL